LEAVENFGGDLGWMRKGECDARRRDGRSAQVMLVTKGFVSGSGDSVCEKLDSVTRADSRTLGYHIFLPKHLPNCGVETLLLRKFSKNQNIT